MTIPQLKAELTDAGVSTRGLRLKADYVRQHLENQGQIQHAATPVAVPKAAVTPKIAVPKAAVTPTIAIPKVALTPKIAVPKVTGQVTPITVPLKITLTPKALPKVAKIVPKVAGPVRTPSPPLERSPARLPVLGLPIRTRDELMKMTIGQIKAELVQNGVSIQGLKLKADFVQKYLDSQAQVEPAQKVPSPVQKVPSPVQKVPSPLITTIAPLVTIVPKAASPIPKAASPAPITIIPKAASPAPITIIPKAASPTLPIPKPILVPKEQKRPSPGRIRFEEPKLEAVVVPKPEPEVAVVPKEEIKPAPIIPIDIQKIPYPLKGCVATDIGRRPYQEDRSAIVRARIGEHDIFAYFVFDGHGGYEVSQYLVNELPDALVRELAKVPDFNIQPDQVFDAIIGGAIKRAYLNTDRKIFNMNTQAGSTAVGFIQIGDKGYLVNVGDSRALIYIGKKGEIPVLHTISEDHKPDDPKERRRILGAGGFVANRRVDGILAVARAYGDNSMKYNTRLTPDEYPGFDSVVSVEPDIYPIKKEPDQEFIGFLASDGIWDVFGNDELDAAVTVPNLNLETLCKNMIRLAISRRSGDNMTFMAFAS